MWRVSVLVIELVVYSAKKCHDNRGRKCWFTVAMARTHADERADIVRSGHGHQPVNHTHY